ncbi:serine/threonine-protein kinase-like protein CR4 [Iris pallida]|uniref:non-specific serine/threonine protein kinase n=1 Tax=Iris pallida TaxID=29817 RepID=A0AAX6HQH7_IRIPA|nr:serine/threonine-protein kinase-like protein CR4 [Iris pallida]
MVVYATSGGATLLLIHAAALVVAVSSLGSMSSIAVSYGEKGPAFCALSSDGSHLVTCLGDDNSVVYGAPSRLPLLGLTAGDSFVCGLLLTSRQPYCWGSNFYVEMGVPQPMEQAAAYSSISAGDHHLCALRAQPGGAYRAAVDCWGYNMTASHRLASPVSSLTAGSVFSCALLERGSAPFCWGDETGTGVISLIPRNLRFRSLSAGGFHVCGVLENFQVFCWGRSLGMSRGDVDLVPMDPMVSVVGGRFHACGIRSLDRGVVCWGLRLPNSVAPPGAPARAYALAAGDYFTCGVFADRPPKSFCWGNGAPWSLPMAVSPGVCSLIPCASGFFELARESSGGRLCKPDNSRVCLPCSSGCPEGTYQFSPCNSTSDRTCLLNCSTCASPSCSSLCSSSSSSSSENRSKPRRLFALQLPIFVAEIVFAVVLVFSVSLVAYLYVRRKLHNCRCSTKKTLSFRKDPIKIQPEREELKIRRAQVFTYEELESATGGFQEDSQVGKGSFSCVFKGVLKDGTVVAVKRSIVVSSDVKKNSKEFRTELDLLSRLNHAHLLSLLGYCEEGGERLLVYEYMAHGSLYRHLHGKDAGLREQLDWVRRVTIAVQAARGIEYLHGYACPPVIHRDIKSSNILIDEEHNARVSDFGLSLLGPTDSSSPLSELPAGTLGYLDPEYYRLHYLTTKSDVYSFGVLLLEILSGRKAIDMQFEEGNIVEWAVPLIKAGDISAILDPVLPQPAELEALKKIAAVACKCVRMRGKDRPSMDKVTTALERALALLMGSPCNDQPILPTEVVLGSSRLHKNTASSQRSSNQSVSENELGEAEEQRLEYRAPSWITFPSYPSVTSSSRRRKSSVSDVDAADGKASEGRELGNGGGMGDSLRCLEEEIGPASPQEDLFLQHNF